MHNKKLYILITAILLGFLVAIQSRSFENIDLSLRDRQSNVFQELSILKDKNKDLSSEVQELKLSIEQLADQNLALNTIEDEITEYKKLGGKLSVFGPGISVIIDGNITTALAVDLVNEFFMYGAQAVSVNGIRITDQTTGFDTLPQGQILLNGSILSTPYAFNAIGESSTLTKILQLPGGILDRFNGVFPNTKINIISKDIIQMG
ncbi:MAG: DUF881 domain-containing protein [bacterium]|nr:DUF881 domain-containing protein [bacterium]